jgi:hypothetical protein
VILENRVPRIFRLKRNEMVGVWRKLYNEDLCNWYSPPNTIRMIKSKRITWAGHVGCMGKKKNSCRILVGNPEGKRPLGRTTHRCEDNIREIEVGGMDCIHLTYDRDQWRALVNIVMNLRIL